MKKCEWIINDKSISTSCYYKFKIKRLRKFSEEGVPYCPFCGKRVKIIGFNVDRISYPVN